MGFESISDYLGIFVVGSCGVLMVVFAFLGRQKSRRNFRPIRAFSRLSRAIGLAVEAGTRLHISVGRGNLTSPGSAASFAGLSILGRIARTASISDRPPIATAGDGALGILAQDTLRAGYLEVGAGDAYDPGSGQITGLTPFSFATGAMAVIQNEMVSGSILTGSFGPEVALILEASGRGEGFSLAGTDHLPTQAVMLAAAEETLIGEELFAGGAYLRAGMMHVASLQTQDVMRWLLVLTILAGALLKLAQGFL